MEKFNWASHANLIGAHEVVEAQGYLVLNPGADSTAAGAPNDVYLGKISGFLLSASALLEVRDTKQHKWVLLERDKHAPSH